MQTIEPVGELDNQPLIQRNLAGQSSAASLAIMLSKLLKKMLAVSGSGVAVVAVLPVPYLVARSAYYLVTKQEHFTFAEMITTNKIEFWLLGPTTAGLATIAIAPFNAYNTYKTIDGCELNRRCLSLDMLIARLGGLLFLSSGIVNGYNMNYLCNDIMPGNSLAKRIVQYNLVSIGTFFAGVSEGRAVLSYLQQDVPYRWRYIKRSGKSGISCLGLFRQGTQPLSRQQLLTKLQAKLDDIKTISLLGLTDTEIKQHAHLINKLQQRGNLDQAALSELFAICNKPFPKVRFLSSEIAGTTLAGGLAYLGNQNTLNYAYEALVEFERFCGVNDSNFLLQTINFLLPKVGYATGFMLSLFLIQDLFFRDILKATTGQELLQHFLKWSILLLPAFSFGLLNIILTVLNVTLSPLEKILVSLAAIIGATVVSRYGIEGGLKEILGYGNTRRELAHLTITVMQKLRRLDDEQLFELEPLLESSTRLPVPEFRDNLPVSRP